MRAFMEFDAPESCAGCILRVTVDRQWYCACIKRPISEDRGRVERAAFCPLKVTDETISSGVLSTEEMEYLLGTFQTSLFDEEKDKDNEGEG
jgi:hypothetical protein